MKEKELNIIIDNYNKSLKKSSYGTINRNSSAELFSKINKYFLENELYEFEIEFLSSESLMFIKEKSINIKLKKIFIEPSPKSKIYDFVKEHSTDEIHKHITSKAKKGNIDIKEIICLMEIELQKLLDISKKDFKKYTVKNGAFVRFKKEIFLKLINHYKLNQDSISIFFKESNPNYKNIENNFKLIEKELSECEIRAYYFFVSIIDEKRIIRKLKLTI